MVRRGIENEEPAGVSERKIQEKIREKVINNMLTGVYK